MISILGGGKLLEDEIDIQRREKTYSDRLQQIEHVKKVRAVGYRLYKSDPNRPPTPDPSGEIVFFFFLSISYLKSQIYGFDLNC